MKIFNTRISILWSLYVLMFVIVCNLMSCSDSERGDIDLLKTNFHNPPNSSKPRVWWHWMNGNISKDGIKKDLEWMHRSGIGGFQNFDAALMTPQIVEKRLGYMDSEWIDAFQYTTKLADSLNLEMAIAASPGWSESGGPWVKPEDGMKKFVWTEIRVKEGDSNIQLPKPSDITGPFQNIPKQPEFGVPVNIDHLPSYYKDVAVIAYKVPVSDKSLLDLGVKVTSSGGKFSLDQLTDGDLRKSVLLPNHSSGTGWVQFAFPQLQTIKALTIVGGGNPGSFGDPRRPDDARQLFVSDDGKSFRFICNIPAGVVLQHTMAIPETKAKYFRITFKNPPLKFNPLAAAVGQDVKPVQLLGTEIAELKLITNDVINSFEGKAAFAPVINLSKDKTLLANDVVAIDNIIELTDSLKPDGTLSWTVPKGEWKILRFGYSLLGIENHPASIEATGLEVDKLDPVAIKKYFTNYLEKYKNATGGLMGEKGLQYVITDSWEAGAQNWTDNLHEEFLKRRGYSIIPWMPVLTGTIVKSSTASEKFLFDFRETLSEMVSEYHYDGLTEILKTYGMKRYSESHEVGRSMIADGMEVKRTAAIPMSAMWTPGGIGAGMETHEADIRESASVAHIYGQNLVAAESLTAFGLNGSAFSYCPENLKPTADLELACGLNRFVIHTSVHQPLDDKIPGLGLGPFGQWFTRHETWAEQAHAWTEYLSRSSYLLQQGNFVADVLYLYGEDHNITELFGSKLPDIPEGYNYDFVNADALLNVITVNNGRLTTPGGTSYKLLVLDKSCEQMTLPVLKKLQELVQAGANVAGNQPLYSLGLLDKEEEFTVLSTEIFNTDNNSKGRVFRGMEAGEALNVLDVLPDFEYSKSEADSKLNFVHRNLSNTDIYWVSNANDRKENFELNFRVDGMLPEIWHPETGKTEETSYHIEGERTKVSLSLQPNEAVFVVFNGKAKDQKRILPVKKELELSVINEGWGVSFQQDRGALAQTTFENLDSWTENDDPGIKYFSGTASYKKTINISINQLTDNSTIYLDLGEVKNLAEVFVNGKSCGITWKKPFKVDVTNAIKSGENTVGIQVTNLWVNRLIGDMQPDIAEKITYTTMPFYNANSPLKPSGLLGPVRVIQVD